MGLFPACVSDSLYLLACWETVSIRSQCKYHFLPIIYDLHSNRSKEKCSIFREKFLGGLRFVKVKSVHKLAKNRWRVKARLVFFLSFLCWPPDIPSPPLPYFFFSLKNFTFSTDSVTVLGTWLRGGVWYDKLRVGYIGSPAKKFSCIFWKDKCQCG